MGCAAVQTLAERFDQSTPAVEFLKRLGAARFSASPTWRAMMPTLYYAVGACSLAPHIALEWIGEPYEAVKVEFGSEELRAVNPAGAVPTFREDDGWLLTQASAILDYLAHKHPQAGLAGGDDLRAKAEAASLVRFLHLGRSCRLLANLYAVPLHQRPKRCRNKGGGRSWP